MDIVHFVKPLFCSSDCTTWIHQSKLYNLMNFCFAWVSEFPRNSNDGGSIFDSGSTSRRLSHYHHTSRSMKVKTNIFSSLMSICIIIPPYTLCQILSLFFLAFFLTVFHVTFGEVLYYRGNVLERFTSLGKCAMVPSLLSLQKDRQ